MTVGGKTEFATLSGYYVGDDAFAYPQLKFIEKRQWDFAIWVQAIQFSTSLTVFPPAVATNEDDAGLILTAGQTQVGNVAVSEGLQSIICHFTAPNSLGGVTPIASPSSKVSTITFKDCGLYLEARSPLSLFGYGVATDGNFLKAITSIHYRRVVN